ncbi:putative methionine adenosyltransferase 2 subunit beta [Calycina marina]|uniref:Methionine adenosyltransferase 2 subunit beta n=1 Tax=Calycina marina TaxID=1763456 RepID=A0A9P7YZW7_9HELO|nr:putative methionine adenosyltransferase 2 subunit beta [Calycina marina]
MCEEALRKHLLVDFSHIIAIMAKTVLITGGTGLLGRQVVQAFERADWRVVGTGFTRAKPPTILKLDLGDEAAVAKTIEDVKPQAVIHCAANRFPDKCDNDPAGTRALNITASSKLASICAAASIFLIYISTDYVFPGTPGEAPYSANSPANPPNLYGLTKYEGEKAVLGAYESARKMGLGVVLRVPVLYGEAEGQAESAVNVLMNAVWKAQEGAVVVDHWALRYPTNTEDTARVCKDITAKYLDTSDRSKLPTILQFSSEDKFTKYEICKLFAEIMGLPLDGMVANTEGNDPNASLQRPYDCHLSTQALQDLGIPVSTSDFEGWWRREARAFRK